MADVNVIQNILNSNCYVLSTDDTTVELMNQMTSFEQGVDVFDDVLQNVKRCANDASMMLIAHS